MIGELAKEVMAGTITVSENMTLALDKRIAEIDAMISSQLSKIMHHEDFQKLSRLGVVYIISAKKHQHIL